MTFHDSLQFGWLEQFTQRIAACQSKLGSMPASEASITSSIGSGERQMRNTAGIKRGLFR
jgi:hypothetical protein